MEKLNQEEVEKMLSCSTNQLMKIALDKDWEQERLTRWLEVRNARNLERIANALQVKVG